MYALLVIKQISNNDVPMKNIKHNDVFSHCFQEFSCLWQQIITTVFFFTVTEKRTDTKTLHKHKKLTAIKRILMIVISMIDTEEHVFRIQYTGYYYKYVFILYFIRMSWTTVQHNIVTIQRCFMYSILSANERQ